MRTWGSSGRLATACFGLAAALGAATATAVEVDLELVLAVDVSRSMDLEELQVQREGYIAAIVHPAVATAIRVGRHRRIALSYVEWAGPTFQTVVVPWRMIDGPASAAAFVAEIAPAPIDRLPMTSISGVLRFAADSFDNNGFEGARRVIDVSGDGPNNMGEPIEPARDAVVGRGIVINGLPLIMRPSLVLAADGIGLDDYYRDCVVGGTGAFVFVVRDRNRWADTIRRKMIVEIADLAPRAVPRARPAAGPKVNCFIGEEMRRRWSDY